MKKLSKIILGTISMLIGIGLVFLGVSALINAPDWIAGSAYIGLAFIGIALAALGWAIVAGADIRDMIKDIFSGISF